MGRTACTEPQCLYKGALYLYLYYSFFSTLVRIIVRIALTGSSLFEYSVARCVLGARDFSRSLYIPYILESNPH